MASIPFDDLGSNIKKMNRALNAGIAKGMNKGFKRSLKLAITEFMPAGGRGKNAKPPNPPPGPLMKRSGDLARTVEIVPSEETGGELIIGGLQAGSASVRHAGHEDGSIPNVEARPYMAPALSHSTRHILRESAKGAVRAMRPFFQVT